MTAIRAKTLRDVLPNIKMTAGMLAHVALAGTEDDESEVMPAAQLWRREDLLERPVIWKLVDKDQFRRPRLILLLGNKKKAR